MSKLKKTPPKSDIFKKVLESFLNDEVITIQKHLYLWRGHYYQVRLYDTLKHPMKTHIPYKKRVLLKHTRKSKTDSFIKFQYLTKVYGIREMSKLLLKKWFRKLYESGVLTYN